MGFGKHLYYLVTHGEMTLEGAEEKMKHFRRYPVREQEQLELFEDDDETRATQKT